MCCGRSAVVHRNHSVPVHHARAANYRRAKSPHTHATRPRRHSREDGNPVPPQTRPTICVDKNTMSPPLASPPHASHAKSKIITHRHRDNALTMPWVQRRIKHSLRQRRNVSQPMVGPNAGSVGPTIGNHPPELSSGRGQYPRIEIPCADSLPQRLNCPTCFWIKSHISLE